MGDPQPADGARRVLDLARRDRAAATREIERLSTDEQVELVCATPVARRAAVLDLLPAPDEVIARLPEAELCFTAKAMGLESAAWLLEYATPEQVVAALDLDAWSGWEPAPARLDAWLDALAATGDEALERSLAGLDPELLVLWLTGRIAVVQKPDDDPGWEPPAGSQTLEGQFHFVALREGDDAAAILRVLHLLFARDYWTYFRLMQGVIHELPSDNLEWALRWRNGRLLDLGFPAREEAMGLYTHLGAAERDRIPDAARPLDVDAWRLPVWVPRLPEGRDARHLVFRAMVALSPDERRGAFFAFVAVANAVAVADRMDLADAETTPAAIEKAAVWTSRGIEHVAAANQLDAAEVLRRVPLRRLFRVGANLDPEAAGPPRRRHADAGDDGESADAGPAGSPRRAPDHRAGRP